MSCSWKLLFFFLATVPFASSQSDNCVQYESVICSNVTSQYLPTPSGLFGSLVQFELTDDLLVEYGFKNLTREGPYLFLSCYEAALKFVCGSYFPPCSLSGEKVKICQEPCFDFFDVCSSLIKELNITTSIFPNCSTLPTTNCTDLGYVNFDYSDYTCPPPLLPNPNVSVYRYNCPGICCLACPFFDNFYPPGYIAILEEFIVVVCLVVSIFVLILIAIYLTIPSKRSYPQNMITQMSFAIFLTTCAFWVQTFAGRYDTFCISPVDGAGPGTNHLPCVLQGFFLIYGFLSGLLWFTMISVNTFLLIFFRYEEEIYLPWVYTLLSWGLPWISVGVLLAENQFGTGVSPFCSVINVEYSNATFFYPLAIFVFPTFLLTITIFIRVYIVTKRSRNSFSSLLKMQFRPLVFSFYSTFILIIYWVYDKVVLLEGYEETWLPDWFECLIDGNSQAFCSDIPKKYLPNVGGLISILFFIMTLGFVVFLMFVIKTDVIEGLLEQLFSRSSFRPSENHSENNRTTKQNSGKTNVIELEKQEDLEIEDFLENRRKN